MLPPVSDANVFWTGWQGGLWTQYVKDDSCFRRKPPMCAKTPTLSSKVIAPARDRLRAKLVVPRLPSGFDTVLIMEPKPGSANNYLVAAGAHDIHMTGHSSSTIGPIGPTAHTCGVESS